MAEYNNPFVYLLKERFSYLGCMQIIGYRFNYVKYYFLIWLKSLSCFFYHDQLIKGKSTKSLNDQELKSGKDQESKKNRFSIRIGNTGPVII